MAPSSPTTKGRRSPLRRPSFKGSNSAASSSSPAATTTNHLGTSIPILSTATTTSVSMASTTTGADASGGRRYAPSTPHASDDGVRRDEDEGIVMRDKIEWDRDECMGKTTGGREIGVTRPKRRLSRALSATSSPPGSPSGSYHSTSHGHGHGHPLSHVHTHPHEGIISSHHPLRAVSSFMQDFQNSFSRNPPPPFRPDERVSNTYFPVAKDDSPTLFGIELKWISLLTLALQNAFLTIVMHYSRIKSSPGKTYSAAAAVLMNELLKGVISVLIALKRIDSNQIAAAPPPVYSEKDSFRDLDRRSFSPFGTMFHPSRLSTLAREIFSPDCYQLAVPAVLYVIQNNLQYVAASNLDVATFQVTYQMKILTTAFFSVLLLSKRLSKSKWAALLMLAVGVGIVQLQTVSAPASHVAATTSIADGIKVGHVQAALRSDIPEPPTIIPAERVLHPLRGFLAVTAACMTSGLAGVYFELILKTKANKASSAPPDLWIRNTQLSLFSLIPALIPIVFSAPTPDGKPWLQRVIACFTNFNGWAVTTVLTQTFGGLITALVIRYSDNIMKGFATSISIVLSFLASVVLFSYPVTIAFILGAMIVLTATYLYNSPSTPLVSTSRSSVGVNPGSPIPTSAPILGEPQRPSRTSSFINLIGLSSKPGSRRTSTTDLKSQGGQFSLTYGPGQATSGGVSSSGLTGLGSVPPSGPGTPYLSSSYPSSSNVTGMGGVNGWGSVSGSTPSPKASQPQSLAPSPQIISKRPSLTLDTSQDGTTG